MKKTLTAILIGLLSVGCCAPRKQIVVERKIYVYPAGAGATKPRPWLPQTRRDSLIWEASREAMKSASETTRHLRP